MRTYLTLSGSLCSHPKQKHATLWKDDVSDSSNNRTKLRNPPLSPVYDVPGWKLFTGLVEAEGLTRSPAALARQFNVFSRSSGERFCWSTKQKVDKSSSGCSGHLSRQFRVSLTFVFSELGVTIYTSSFLLSHAGYVAVNGSRTNEHHSY